MKAKEDEIRELVKGWEYALSMKDATSLLKDYVDDVTLFDIGTQLESVDAYRKLWEACFPYFGPTIGTQRKDTRIHVGNDMAVMHGYTRLTGMDSTADMAKSWMRTTVCFKRIDGDWKVIHEHVSLPVNCETERPNYILDTE